MGHGVLSHPKVVRHHVHLHVATLSQRRQLAGYHLRMLQVLSSPELVHVSRIGTPSDALRAEASSTVGNRLWLEQGGGQRRRWHLASLRADLSGCIGSY